MKPHEDIKKSFFVGYLPMPRALLRFYLPLSVALFLFAAAGGYWLAALQKSAGHADWNTAEVTTLHGVLTLSPYPVLHRVHAGDTRKIESVLLVARGKHAADIAPDFDGSVVAVRGAEIVRGNFRMVELSGGEDAVTLSAAEVPDLRARVQFAPLKKIKLRGEVADSKCFLGVMKPGVGRAHKACAEVCILGGIPPMLLARDHRGDAFGYMLMDAEHKSLSQLAAKFAGESVTVSGQLFRRGGLLFVAVDGGGMRRW